MKLTGSQDPSRSNSDQFSCRNCGSTDIAVVPTVKGGRVVADASVLGGIRFGRCAIQGRDHGNVSFGSSSQSNVQNMETVLGTANQVNNRSIFNLEISLL